MRKSLTAAMAALTFGGAIAATAAPAEARDYYGHGGRYYDRHRGNNTGAAVAAGVVGLALGAALASSSHNNNGYSRSYSRGYYDDGYYGGGYSGGGYARDGYYGGQRYAYRTCESSRWVWDPYIRERVLIRSHYAC
ncbi:MAG: hypothetical protein JWQ29_727 [Phenylobacterium sp.]|nr:hypothetical protein [Phenylobacterium sp.]